MQDIILKSLYSIFPVKIINNHSYSIERFMRIVSKEANKRILDIGAGELPYKKYFNKCQYESQDVVDNSQKNLDYICDANKIPVKDNRYDYLISTQVLEHLKEPHKAFKEMNRILKKNGKVFLTTHLCMEEHMLPYDYFRYTRYGLEYLATSNKFKVERITPQGGRFLVLAKQIQTAIPHILSNKYLIYLYYIIAIIPIFLIDCVLYVLDNFDRDRHLTTNYECIFVK